ncbi:uncharacterized protein VDAG_00171 [Verticillium dahliae VdLs.17]|uniref:DUF3824 domain-containing protein n=1 Tax=Verticillium dahliae (strain VdLs.17 / ATCC MYA-4575 / FGSC 10137) TaxID=498257 RepID=G2WRI8_VERDV|nr:uncharacterized protein VDAG_00171 [Verticillium dahliae VdLs.17]EGY13489.1 hypothetical protein VDAG_00171 [Verticillium dahliae VdLs.17]KAH6709943.1 hypothetical protein EV126DRAFT_437946 [Verticillium dahliae]
MAYRETSRVYHDDDDFYDEDAYRTTTVRRYKVTPSRVGRVDADDDNRRSHYSYYPARNSGDLLPLDTRDRDRAYAPDRPRSAFEPRDDLDRFRDRDRDSFRDGRTVVYEREREVERERDPHSARDWDRRSHAPWDNQDAETEVRVDKRVERRDDGEIKVERRIEERREDQTGHGGPEIERYRKETEYYAPLSPPPVPQAPVVIQRPAPEPQKIIVQEAPPPAPVILQQRESPGVMVVREREQPREIARREPRDDEYYYRRETRDLGPYRRDEREYAMERRDHRDREYDRGYGSGDEEYWVRRKTIIKERSPSPDTHRRHLAGGALAGAGVAALLASRRDDHGEIAPNRGRKVLAGAALGGLGTEVFKRARSAYDERYGDNRSRSRHRHEDRYDPRYDDPRYDDRRYDDRRYDDRYRSRSRSSSRSKIKTGLGVAAAALAIAGAAKYYQNQKIDKEEASRGRSRTRNRSYSSSRSRSARKKSRSKSVAKAAAATAAATGLIQHFRNKSGSRSRSRSKSRIRQGAEVVAAGLAGGAASKLWHSRKDKKEAKERELSDEEYEEEQRRRDRAARRRSRSRSQARSLYSEPRTDGPIGLVEYGTDPLPPSQPPYPTNDYGYESASSQRRRRRSRGRGADDYSPSGSDTGKKRSRSRIRDMAAAAVGTGAAAIGIKEYKKKKDAEKEREDEAARRARERSLSRDYSRDRSRRRDEGRRRYEEESNPNPHYDDYSRPPSPPHASGGAYYPTPTGSGFSQNQSVNDPYPPYSPHAYTGFPPPQPGGPPTASGAAGGFPTPTPGGPPLSYQGGPPPIGGGPPPAGGRLGPDHVSDDTFHTTTPKDSVSRNAAPPIATREDGLRGQSPRRRERRSASISSSPEAMRSADAMSMGASTSATKSVTWGPLSPKSSFTLERHRQVHEQQLEESTTDSVEEGFEPPVLSEAQLAALRPVPLRRRSSDPTPNRPIARRGRTSEVDNDVEDLPDRFDDHGRPLDGRGLTSRGPRYQSGSFEYRPRNDDQGKWNVNGSWAATGTDNEVVHRLMGDVEGLVSGRKNWGDVLQDLVKGLQSGGGDDVLDDRQRRSRRHTKRRGLDYD